MVGLSIANLVLIEGIPGSGKSAAAQYITRCLAQAGIPCQWFYEENLKHPVYMFDDAGTMSDVVNDLMEGRFDATIAAALERWRGFIRQVHDSEMVTVIDSCLFGYLTWSLFPAGAERRQILDYIMSVGQLIKSTNSAVVYFYQDDIESSLKRMIRRHGPGAENENISAVTESVYGKQHHLTGFLGLVEYWKEYRQMTDCAFSSLEIPKTRVETSLGDWGQYYRQIADFLDVPPLSEPEQPLVQNVSLAGHYQEAEAENPVVVHITVHEGLLRLTGHPLIWPNTPLLPETDSFFHVFSLPFTIQFTIDEHDAGPEFILDGPEQLGGKVKSRFQRVAKNIASLAGLS